MMLPPARWPRDRLGWLRLYAMARGIAYTFSVWHGFDFPAITFILFGNWTADDLVRPPRTGLHGAALYQARVPRALWSDAEALADRLRVPRATWTPVRG